MKKERQYLTEVSRMLDSINRTGDLRRKELMKRHLHKDIYPRMTYYGFKTIAEVRKSLECMKVGTPDPSAESRYEYMKKVAAIMEVNIAEYEKSRGIKSPSHRLSLHYDSLKSKADKDLPERER